jgi:DNA invertase Pin-like site-specific DNA recombinase
LRDTLNLIHHLAARSVGIRNLADPIKVDFSSPTDLMAQLTVVLLALFAQMERTYGLERAAGARAAATARGQRIGRPSVVGPDKLAYATPYATPDTPSPRSSVTKTGITRTSRYRHLPPHPVEPVTAGPPTEPLPSP